MATVHHEVETTFSLGPEVDVPSVLATVAAGPGLEWAEPQAHRLEATYFDTVDHLLARARVSLRRRVGGDDEGWHLKLPLPDGSRAEVRLPAGRAVHTVPAPLRRMVRVRTEDAALTPVVQMVTERTVQALVDAEGTVLLEVADDRVSARRLAGRGEEEVAWRELEVELVQGDGRLLEEVGRRLEALGIAVSADRSKVARVLGADAEPSSSPGRRVGPESSAGEVVMGAVAAHTEQVLVEDSLIRLERPGGVHRMRVATRRLRSALRTFAPLFDADAARAVRTELAWLAEVLGAARDAEVMRERWAAEAAAGDTAAAQVVAVQDEEHRTAYRQVLAELDGERYHRLVARLGDLVRTPPLTPVATEPAATVLPARVARSSRRLATQVEGARAEVAGPDRDAHLHEARKAAKRARYAAETLADAFGRPAVRFAAAMEDVQEVLGEHQDSVVMRRRLQALATEEGRTPAEAFGYGVLHAREEARGARAERDLDAAWTRASAKKLRRWLS